MAVTGVGKLAGGNETAARAADKPLAELAGDLSRELSALVHHEIELAKVEMTEKGKRAGIGAGLFSSAAVMAVFGLGCLTAAAVAGMGRTLSVWLAAVIVGAVYLVAAGLFAVIGRREVARATPPVPTEAVESTKEDVAWLRSQTKSAPR